MRRLGSNDPCGLVSCTRYGDVDEVSEALGPCWRRAGSQSLSSWYLLIFCHQTLTALCAVMAETVALAEVAVNVKYLRAILFY